MGQIFKLAFGIVFILCTHGCAQTQYKKFSVDSDLTLVGRIVAVEEVPVIEIDLALIYQRFSLRYDEQTEGLIKFFGGFGCSATNPSQSYVVFIRRQPSNTVLPYSHFGATACIPVEAQLANQIKQYGH